MHSNFLGAFLERLNMELEREGWGEARRHVVAVHVALCSIQHPEDSIRSLQYVNSANGSNMKLVQYNMQKLPISQSRPWFASTPSWPWPSQIQKRAEPLNLCIPLKSCSVPAVNSVLPCACGSVGTSACAYASHLQRRTPNTQLPLESD